MCALHAQERQEPSPFCICWRLHSYPESLLLLQQQQQQQQHQASRRARHSLGCGGSTSSVEGLFSVQNRSFPSLSLSLSLSLHLSSVLLASSAHDCRRRSSSCPRHPLATLAVCFPRESSCLSLCPSCSSSFPPEQPRASEVTVRREKERKTGSGTGKIERMNSH